MDPEGRRLLEPVQHGPEELRQAGGWPSTAGIGALSDTASDNALVVGSRSFPLGLFPCRHWPADADIASCPRSRLVADQSVLDGGKSVAGSNPVFGRVKSANGLRFSLLIERSDAAG